LGSKPLTPSNHENRQPVLPFVSAHTRIAHGTGRPGLHFRSLLSLPEVHRVYLEDYIGIDTASPALRLVALMVCPPEQATEQVREILTNPAPLPMPREEWVGFIETILV